jgi:hypothetical protein
MVHFYGLIASLFFGLIIRKVGYIILCILEITTNND